MLVSSKSSSILRRLLRPILAFVVLLFLGTVWILPSTPNSAWNASPDNHAPLPISFSHPHDNGIPSHSSATLKTLFKTIHPTQHSFAAENGRIYTIAADMPVWKESLREQVLILDMDTRSLRGETQILHNETVPWSDMKPSLTGLLNHYMYALIHGYQYKLIRPRAPENRFGSWAKPSVLADTLKTHRIVVLMDADALWNHPEIPLEWLLNHWNITQDTSLAMSLDPAMYKDSFGRIGLNTGFIIAQQSPRTEEILASWAECPSGWQFPGCEQWANQRVFEQTAFNEYIRYAFNQPEDLRELPSDETNGYPGADMGCTGTFVRHFWKDKGRIKEAADPTMQKLTQALHGRFLEHVEDLVIEEAADP